MDEVDIHISTSKREIEKTFYTAAEEVFSVPIFGTIATGRVVGGTIRTGGTVEIVGSRETRGTTIIGSKISEKTLDQIFAGDTVEICIS
jgi:elongation factor Tu